MIKIMTLVLMGSVIISCKDSEGNTQEAMTVPFLGSVVEFSTVDKSKLLLGTSDEYTASQSAFDNMAKTQNTANKTEADYLQFAADQAQAWTNDEIADAKKAIEDAQKKITELGLTIPLPAVIPLVKSTCSEEGSAAGYTRQNYIVVSGAPDVHLFLHELFHVISRNDPALRDKLYQTIGFNKMSKLTYPENLLESKITNPDAPFFEHSIEVDMNGEATDVVILTLANGPYESGIFFNYLQVKLLELEKGTATPKLVQGEPILREFSAATDLLDKIGNNTGYNIHPEEILAEHFTMLVDGKTVPRQDLIDAMKLVLQP